MEPGVDLARPPAPYMGVGGPEPLMIVPDDLTDVARAAVSCAGAPPGGAARPEPAPAAVCTTATPCPDTYTHETSLMPAHDVFHRQGCLRVGVSRCGPAAVVGRGC